MSGSRTIAALLHPFSYASGRPGVRAADSPPRFPRNLMTESSSVLSTTPSSEVGLKKMRDDSPTSSPDFARLGRETTERSRDIDAGSVSNLRMTMSDWPTEESEQTKMSDCSSEFLITGRSEGDKTALVHSQDMPTPPNEAVDDPAQDIAVVRKATTSPEFQNKHFVVAPSTIAGWGAFAARDLQPGDVILREEALILADGEDDLFREFDKLDPHTKQVALSLHANEPKDDAPRLKAVWNTNCFATAGPTAGLFAIAARFNHACHPAHNVEYAFDGARRCLTLSVRAARIPRGRELTISYGSDRTPQILYLWYGFRCRCGACRGLGDEELRRLLASQW